jgi:polysaccharide biosynthesis protein PslJ
MLLSAAQAGTLAYQRPRTRAEFAGLVPYVLFLSYPIFWFLGLPWLWGIALTTPMTVSLLTHFRSVRVPRGLWVWVLFLSWQVLSGLQLVAVGPDRVMAFMFRFFEYYTGTILLLWFFNSDAKRLPWVQLVKAGAWLWAITIVLGTAGLLFPGYTLQTLGSKILPANLMNITLVSDYALPKLSQVQNIIGSRIARPAAPFSFSNGWASNVAIFTPFAMMAFSYTRRNGVRLLLGGLMIFGLLPFISSVSRGAWVGLIFGLVYAAIRISIRRGAGLKVVKVAMGLVAVALIIFLSPLRGIIEARLAHPHSNQGRLEQSQEAARRATQSPLLGYGAPLPSEDEDIGHNIGTHGQIWLVVFSHGFPGLALYLGFFGFVAWHFRRCRTQAELWAHTLVLMAIVMMPVYGFMSLNFDITMAALGIAFRDELLPRGAPGDPAIGPDPAEVPA